MGAHIQHGYVLSIIVMTQCSTGEDTMFSFGEDTMFFSEDTIPLW